MWDGLESVLGYIETVWELMLSWVQSVVNLIYVIRDAVFFPVSVQPYLPDFLATAVVVVLAVWVVRFLVLR